MKLDRGLTIERMTELGRVSRSGFYRFNEVHEWTGDADMDLRDSIQRIALELPSYGRPRITAEWIAAQRFEVEIGWARCELEVQLRPFYDPELKRVRS